MIRLELMCMVAVDAHTMYMYIPNETTAIALTNRAY